MYKAENDHQLMSRQKQLHGSVNRKYLKKNGSCITLCYYTAQIPNGLDDSIRLVVAKTYLHAKHAIVMEAQLTIFAVLQYLSTI